MYQSWQLAKVLQSNLYTVPEVEVHNGKVSCFCGKHFLVFIDISFFSGNISPFFCKKTIIYVIIQNWKKIAYLIHKEKAKIADYGLQQKCDQQNCRLAKSL